MGDIGVMKGKEIYFEMKIVESMLSMGKIPAKGFRLLFSIGHIKFLEELKASHEFLDTFLGCELWIFI